MEVEGVRGGQRWPEKGKGGHTMTVLNQYLARHWAASFREEISNLVGAKSVRMEDLMGMF